eukprot:554968-Rhodomonas_salina.1
MWQSAVMRAGMAPSSAQDGALIRIKELYSPSTKKIFQQTAESERRITCKKTENKENRQAYNQQRKRKKEKFENCFKNARVMTMSVTEGRQDQLERSQRDIAGPLILKPWTLIQTPKP